MGSTEWVSGSPARTLRCPVNARRIEAMFSLKLTARPDARMVEVPLEIEAELPREFDGGALLASSGLPRRVRLRAAKDALKLSTAYRADRLVGDIVRAALRGTAADVQRVQDAVMKFVRAVRERRQDGATLVVSSNGRGKIEVVEVPGSRPPVPSAPLQPYETTRPPTTQERAAPDRVALLAHPVTERHSSCGKPPRKWRSSRRRWNGSRRRSSSTPPRSWRWRGRSSPAWKRRLRAIPRRSWSRKRRRSCGRRRARMAARALPGC